MSNYGVENIKKTSLTAIVLQRDVQKAMADRKITFPEAMTLFNDVLGVNEIVANAATIKAEYKDMDVVEKEEVKAYVKAELELKEDVEELITCSLDFVDSGAKLAVAVKKVFGTKDTTGETPTA